MKKSPSAPDRRYTASVRPRVLSLPLGCVITLAVVEDEVTAWALAAGAGDRRALDRFITATQHDVRRLVSHLTDPRIADDLTQDVYVRALRALPTFAGRSSARTWLLSIARRTVIDHLRARGARPRIADVDYEAVATRVRGAGFEQVVEIRQLVADLAPERREALLLTQVLGLSYAEAAAACGCPVGTIRSRVARAREDLVCLGGQSSS